MSETALHHAATAVSLPSLLSPQRSAAIINANNNNDDDDELSLAHRRRRELHLHPIIPIVPNVFVQQRQGSILARGIILKSDSFPASIIDHSDLQLLGAPNMRQVRPFLLFGLGQPTVSGIRAMLNFLKAKPSYGRRVHWITTREEPIIYLNNRPFSIRELSAPFHNISDLNGISVHRLDEIESRLKLDILAEAESNDGNFLVHDEIVSNEVRACFEAVSDSTVRTTREVFDLLARDGYNVDLVRVPITPESVIEPIQFDAIVRAIVHNNNRSNQALSKPPLIHSQSTPLSPLSLTGSGTTDIHVFNCQLGRGRSTFGMIIAFLVNCRLIDTEPSIIVPPAAAQSPPHPSLQAQLQALSLTHSSDTERDNDSDNHDRDVYFNYRRGDWDVILKLVRLLHNGRRAKQSVDSAIDACGRVHHIRDSIVDAFTNAEHARSANQTNEHANEMAAALRKYFYLICFESWLLESPSTMDGAYLSARSFSHFIQQHPELTKLSDSFIRPDSIVELQQAPATQAAVPLPDECDAWDSIVFARSGPVLSRFTIIKSEFFAPRGRHRPELSAVMKHYRVIHDLHISATAQPNVPGIRTIIKDLVHERAVNGSGSGDVRIVIVNLREEPVLFMRSEPFLLRDWRHPFRILPEFTTGVSASRIEQIEQALKSDIIKEWATSGHHRHVLIHEEISERQIRAQHLQLTDAATEILTNKQVFDTLKTEGLNVDYHRIPLHVEEAPSIKAIDKLFVVLNAKDLGSEVSVVFWDQKGGRRSTIGMVLACLVMIHQGSLDLQIVEQQMQHAHASNDESATANALTETPAATATAAPVIDRNVAPPIDLSSSSSGSVEPLPMKRTNSTIIAVDESSREATRASNGRGEFKGILNLIRILKRGRAMKEEVDLAIDVCGTVHNLRDAISDALRQHEGNRAGSTNKTELFEAAKMLESYALLIAFNSYLHERKEKRGEMLSTASVRAEPTGGIVKELAHSLAPTGSVDLSQSSDLAARTHAQREALLRNEEIDASELVNYNAFNPYTEDGRKASDSMIEIEQESEVDSDVPDRSPSSNNSSELQRCNASLWPNNRPFRVHSPSSSPLIQSRSLFEFPTFSAWLHSRPELRLCLELIHSEPDEALKLNQIVIDEKFARAFDRRDGNVLVRGSLLKSDHFVGVVNKNVHQLIEGAINFRPIEAFPVAGTGIPTGEGIQRILEFYTGLNGADSGEPAVMRPPFAARSMMWLMLREEPILYVQHRPFVVRDADNPYSNLENTGITTRRVEAMERMLKRDTLNELRASGRNELLLHDEDNNGTLFAYLEHCDESALATPREEFERVFDTVRKHLLTVKPSLPFTALYHRTPITDEQAPSPAGIDAMIQFLEAGRKEESRAIIANCQMGRGRTTTGLIIACLWCIQRGKVLDYGRFPTIDYNQHTVHPSLSYDSLPSPAAATQPAAQATDAPGITAAMEKQLRAGWFKVIQSLVRVLPSGQAVKAEVDRVIDECSAMQNLRSVCYDLAVIALTCLPRKRAFFIRRGSNYLIRYFMLIVINAYLNQEKARSYATPFVEWLNQRQEIINLLQRVDFPPVPITKTNSDRKT